MPFIALTTSPSSNGVTGKTYFSPPSLDANGASFQNHEMYVPDGVGTLRGRPSACQYARNNTSRMYIVGGHTDNLVITENLYVHKQGIVPPSNPFVAGAGSGSAIGVAAAVASGTGRTGECICYVRWRDAVHARSSPLSGPSPAVTLSGQGVAWTNLPTSCEDRSVTHIDLFVSMDGNVPRLAVSRDLGAVSATEEIPTLSLGEAYSDDFEKFPRCRYNIIWHFRQVMSGNGLHPNRIYFSLLDQPEDYGGFYLETLSGDAVVGLYAVRDNLFVATAKTTYIVTGYTETDIKMDVFEPEIGLIAHHGVGYFDDYAIIPTQRGFYVNNGSTMIFSSKGHEQLWRDEYETYRSQYEDGWAVVDPNDDVYKFCIGSEVFGLQSAVSSVPVAVRNSVKDVATKVIGSNPGFPSTCYWTMDLGSIGKGETLVGGPQLIFDVRYREDKCAAQVSFPGSSRSDVITGSSDGYIRLEGVDGASDDSDDLDNIYIIITKHYDFELEGGGHDDGWKLPYCWAFVEAESEDQTLGSYLFAVMGGNGHEYPYDIDFSYTTQIAFDDSNSQVFQSGWTGPLGQIGLSQQLAGSGWVYTPSTVNRLTLGNISGKGFTFIIGAVGGMQIYFRGIGGKVTPSPAHPSTIKVQTGD